MTYQTLQFQVTGNIARVTVNRPDALNALNKTVLEELLAVFGEINRNADVRGVIVTGAGEKAFVAGADIAGMKGLSPTQAGEFCRLGHNCMNAIQHCKWPVIAAVNGFALGGGLELALSCDFIYASQTAKFGLPEVNLGIFPGFGGTQRLPRLVGRNRAKEIILTADMMTAEQAFEFGIVNKICEPAALIAAAEATLGKIATKGPLAVQAAKRCVNLGTDLPLAQGLEIEAGEFPQIFSSQDAHEGITAFVEKRKPTFKGN